MLKIILLIVVIALAAFVIVVAMKPDDFKYSRSALMNAPASVVFDQVNNFHHWDAWSPWAKLDPASKETFTGPESGKDAGMSWKSEKNSVGEGRMTILESRPNELIHINLEFIKPFAGTNLTEFTFRPEGNQTRVTWTMSGKSDKFFMKAMGVLMNCEKMIDDSFDQGLASMKAVVEAKSAP